MNNSRLTVSQAKKAALWVSMIATLLAVLVGCFAGIEQWKCFLVLVGQAPVALATLFLIGFASALWAVYFAVKEQASNTPLPPQTSAQPA